MYLSICIVDIHMHKLIYVGLGKIFLTNICLKENLNMTSMLCDKESN